MVERPFLYIIILIEWDIREGLVNPSYRSILSLKEMFKNGNSTLFKHGTLIKGNLGKG
jgi:hypothetical protein